MEIKQLTVPFVLALLMATCVFSDPVRLTAADNGRTNSVPAGGDIEIVLKGNPTTGYSWEVDSFSTNKLQQMGTVEYKQNETLGGKEMVGVGGKFTFRFKALAPGQGSIKLIYRRSWETTAYDKVYSVVLDVK